MITQDTGWLNSLLSEFCDIYFVCSSGAPNSMGWIVLVTSAVIVIALVSVLWEMIQGLDE